MTCLSRLLLVSLTLTAGCAVPVVADLEEAEANRIVVALEENGIAARKQADPASEGRWRISVPQSDASPAVRVLRTEGLPTQSSPGVLDALGKGSIVPSRTSEHAKFVAGVAGELERSLSSVDGVLAARVHLAVPEADPWTPAEKKPEPSASVLLQYRGERPALAPDEVQKLVAGAISNLSAERVTVVTTQAPTTAANRVPTLAYFGPIAVARSSLLPLRALVAAAALLNIVLLAVVLLLWRRARRAPSVAPAEPLAGAQARPGID